MTEAYEAVLDPKTQTWNMQKVDPTEYWTCNGKSIFQVDAKKKQIIEQPIPAELQGKSITDGPLPFVFGAKADTLRKRYFMRIVTPPDAAKTRFGWKRTSENAKRRRQFFARRTDFVEAGPAAGGDSDLQPRRAVRRTNRAR